MITQSRRSNRWQDESGQSLVILALFMVVLIGMLGVVIDVGFGYAQYRRMQNAADVAALGGVRELAKGNGVVTAESRMDQLLADNGADPDLSDYEVIDVDQTSVVARTVVQPFFMPLFGINELRLEVDSEGIYGQAYTEENLLPFAVDENRWNPDPGTPVNIWAGETGPGNFGWVHWTGQSIGTTILRMNIDDPSNSDRLAIGDYVAGKPGASFSAVRPSLEAKEGETINVFLYDPDEVTGAGVNLSYRVTGFAKFRIVDIRSNGVDSEIWGTFVESIQLGGEIYTGDPIGTLATGLTE